MAQWHNVSPSTEVDKPTPKKRKIENTGHFSGETGLLHPSVTITWEHCHQPQWSINHLPTHCAALKDRVAILTTDIYGGGPDVVYTFSTDLQLLCHMEGPNKDMSLTIYQSKFVLVGGRDHSTLETTNELFTSSTGQDWEPSLPPMPTKRFCTSTVSTRSPKMLIVAGGMGSKDLELNVVEILKGKRWTTVASLPLPACSLSTTIHEKNLYFMKKTLTNTVYTCSYDTLISKTDHNSYSSSFWQKLSTHCHYDAMLSCSSQLVIIDHRGNAKHYSCATQSWLEASVTGERPNGIDEYNIPMTVIPTGEILYCHQKEGIFRGTISVSRPQEDKQEERGRRRSLQRRCAASEGLHMNPTSGPSPS